EAKVRETIKANQDAKTKALVTISKCMNLGLLLNAGGNSCQVKAVLGRSKGITVYDLEDKTYKNATLTKDLTWTVKQNGQIQSYIHFRGRTLLALEIDETLFKLEAPLLDL